MSGIVARLAEGLAKPINPFASIILAVMTLMWGLWVLNPYWVVFNSAPLFDMMEGLAPEEVWGATGVLAGGLLAYCNIKRNLRLLSIGLWVVSWFWGMVALMMWLGDWTNTGALTYSYICLWSNYAYLNVKMNSLNRHPS